MARGRRFRPQARRKMIWARNGEALNPTALGTAVDLLADFRADGGTSLGSTITRCHVTLNVWWDGFQPSVTSNQLFIGVIVDQLQLDSTEVPRPAVELHADWMYWRAHPPVPEGAVASPADGTTEINTLHTVVVDVKSQRKCEELGQTLWLVLDPTFGGGAQVNISYTSSVLLKLP